MIEHELEQELAGRGIASLTTAVLRGEDRALTTAIAEALHGKTLDDGTEPLGVHFGSKHGGGWCRAIWLDRATGAGTMDALSGEPVLLADDDLLAVAGRFRIRTFGPEPGLGRSTWCMSFAPGTDCLPPVACWRKPPSRTGSSS